MSLRTPPLLEGYLALPPETSLIVLSGILGASTNWLVLRYLHSLLHPGTTTTAATLRNVLPEQQDGSPAQSADPVSVLLVSFLRDFAFWRDGASRLGVDLEALGRKGRFGFVDGLSGMFLGTGAPPRPPGQNWKRTLSSPDAAALGGALRAAVDGLLAHEQTAGRVVLVIDQLDFLLAAAGAEKLGLQLQELLLDLREKVHCLILTVSADEPLVAAQTTSLEKEHASFVLSLAHEAEIVLSLRLLDTGTAKDVSGVIRITRGGAECGRDVEEREYLYYVGGDGGVRVFERGQ